MSEQKRQDGDEDSKRKELVSRLYAATRKNSDASDILLELLAYESAYFQRQISIRGVSERDADFHRGQLSAIKKLARRLKGESQE